MTTGDIAIASDRAEFFDPHVSIGLVSGREVVRLARVLPINIAMRIALMGRHERMSAQRAYDLGLISEVVEHDRLLERAREIAALVNRNAPLAVRGHPPRHPQGHRPAAARGRDPGRGLPRAGRCAPTTPRRARGPSSRSARPSGSADERADYATIRYETTPDHVATITLDRPEVLNAFDRQMCEEMRAAWRRVKDDPAVNAVVLRAAGDRAFCAGLDIKKPYGQPDDVWNHEDPGELLSPKWQKVWKPVVCAVQGICTAGAFYFLNEADIVICSPDATFFDSHVTYGWCRRSSRSGLMRRVGLGETLRIALSGNDERVTRRDRAADRPRHRGRRRATSSGTGPTRSPPASRRKPTRGDAGHGARDLGVARPALPRRDGAGPDLHPARQPDRHGRGAPSTRPRRAPPRIR